MQHFKEDDLVYVEDFPRVISKVIGPVLEQLSTVMWIV